MFRLFDALIRQVCLAPARIVGVVCCARVFRVPGRGVSNGTARHSAVPMACNGQGDTPFLRNLWIHGCVCVRVCLFVFVCVYVCVGVNVYMCVCR